MASHRKLQKDDVRQGTSFTAKNAEDACQMELEVMRALVTEIQMKVRDYSKKPNATWSEHSDLCHLTDALNNLSNEIDSFGGERSIWALRRHMAEDE